MSTTSPFPHLFRPIQVGAKTLKHRLNFGAHTANMSAEGLPAERHLGYYRERAMGGAAMIVVEPVPIHRTAVLTRGNFRHDDDGVVPHFRRITDACHEHGTVMIQQLYHVGAHGDGATVIDLLDESERRVDADALVLATVNAPERALADALAESAREVHAIGDCVAARQAPAAVYEGRKLGLEL